VEIFQQVAMFSGRPIFRRLAEHVSLILFNPFRFTRRNGGNSLLFGCTVGGDQICDAPDRSL
jgi:hypothetical protein